MIPSVEQLMYRLSDFFMAPVLLLLVLLFIYSLTSMGEFVMQYAQRRKNRPLVHYWQQNLSQPLGISGYPLLSLFQTNRDASKDAIDVAALEALEGVRMVSRIAPMLGLIATMIPMGPALKSLGEGNVQGISDNLVVAFSAVIFGLVIASITFFIASVKKRWLAAELVLINDQIAARQTAADGGHLREAA